MSNLKTIQKLGRSVRLAADDLETAVFQVENEDEAALLIPILRGMDSSIEELISIIEEDE